MIIVSLLFLPVVLPFFPVSVRYQDSIHDWWGHLSIEAILQSSRRGIQPFPAFQLLLCQFDSIRDLALIVWFKLLHQARSPDLCAMSYFSKYWHWWGERIVRELHCKGFCHTPAVICPLSMDCFRQCSMFNWIQLNFRILSSYEAKIAKICNLWTSRPVIQLMNCEWGQNVQKLHCLLFCLITSKYP